MQKGMPYLDMKRIMLRVAYDGTNYCGWQLQPNGITVEEVLNRNLKALLKEDINVIGASRTDSGVHALGNVAIFDTDTRIPGDKISYALNQKLPGDIVIQESREVPADFHPRRCNSIKTYRYTIQNSRFPLPTTRLYSYFVHYPLNELLMQEAAAYLMGEHDFKSFCSANTHVKDTVRRIYDINVEKTDERIDIIVSGNGFLYNMVRIIAGTLVRVGLGAYPPIKVQEILNKKERSAAGPKAPAEGLTLLKLEYPDLM
ncbi:tRNA pseudouridine synthase A [Anaerocolumna cellulosilytica]|uniref:tRNA pseudouridine synthase A n=2 Tax=Anaerocolumna cellulosilytica TaxID=433286 RepID=A0A6S6R0J4_9FIRM|nr:tRNA pseudouridine synthase A [Anaerocolumna cellulosilytica]